MSIGDRINRILKRQGISQRTLAKLSGINQTRIFRILHGSTPDVFEIINISKKLGIPVSDLTGEDDTHQTVANVFGVPAEMLMTKTLQDYSDDELLHEIKRRLKGDINER